MYDCGTLLNFYLVAAYSPHEARLKEFTKRIATSHHATGVAAAKYRIQAEQILQLDEAEADKKLGQNLRETFPLADVFVNVTDKDAAQKSFLGLSSFFLAIQSRFILHHRTNMECF
ncbi:MAG: hypothetical protein C4293_03970 [Nitrospiraceae bacterium]